MSSKHRIFDESFAISVVSGVAAIIVAGWVSIKISKRVPALTGSSSTTGQVTVTQLQNGYLVTVPQNTPVQIQYR